MLRAAIVGSRDFKQPMLIWNLVAQLDQYGIDNEEQIVIISGGARGVDTEAERAARHFELHCEVFKPNWELGKGAGFIRNEKIIAYSDVVYAFWDGQSKGTLHSIAVATREGRPVWVWRGDEYGKW